MIKDHCSIMSREPRSLHTSDASACRRWRCVMLSSSALWDASLIPFHRVDKNRSCCLRKCSRSTEAHYRDDAGPCIVMIEFISDQIAHEV
mmetsp:Transcript_19244/g.48076  ORF Transcript_19244/g.48076 Transcript_19244/m.48076 type:complete len:90 (+) Transcript_19244:734-1003(+)